jgi:hypothetical protein
MNNTSSQDEFAKWAKLRRRHDKSMEEYETMSTFPPSFLLFLFLLSLQLVIELLTGLFTTHRQIPLIPKNLLRLDRQDRPLAKHKRPQAVPAVLVLQETCLCPSGGLVPVLRGVGAVLPPCTAGVGQCPGLEQCVRGGHRSRGGYGGIGGGGYGPAAQGCTGGWISSWS